MTILPCYCCHVTVASVWPMRLQLIFPLWRRSAKRNLGTGLGAPFWACSTFMLACHSSNTIVLLSDSVDLHNVLTATTVPQLCGRRVYREWLSVRWELLSPPGTCSRTSVHASHLVPFAFDLTAPGACRSVIQVPVVDYG